jgi:ABC-type Fe3+/spermidine/putrescine transport system ATPase subunit
LRNAQTAAIIVTHDQAEALAIADRIALLHDGVLHQIGTPEALFATPCTRFAAAFMGQADFIAVQRNGTELLTELGPLTLHDPHKACYEQTSILVRHDDVTFAPTANNPNAVIAERHYEGTMYHYRVRFGSGQMVSCKLRHDEKYEVDTPVLVRYIATHPLVYFIGEHAHGLATPLSSAG